MTSHPRKKLLGLAALSLCLATLGCEKTRADTKNPQDERAGAGADGNNSAPESLSDGGPDPDKTSLTQPSVPADAATNPDAGSPPPSPAPQR